ELSTNILSSTDLNYLKALGTNDFISRSNAAWLQAVVSLKTLGTNDFLTLRKLASVSFDPQQTVLLAQPPPSAAGGSPSVTNQNPGTVDFVSYAPKRIVLRARANEPSILLLNDRFDPGWSVSVDGKPEMVLRCNFLMRGVQLAPGDHTVEFRFAPPITGFY